MKQQIKQLIDRLADKSLTFGCEVEYAESQGVSIQVGGRGRIIFYFQGKFFLEHGITNETATITKILGHPILLTDMLKHIEGYEYAVSSDGHFLKCVEVRETGQMVYEGTGVYWEPTKSLQQIFAEAEWETGYMWEGKFCQSDCTVECEVPKQPAIRELFQFLLQLGL